MNQNLIDLYQFFYPFFDYMASEDSRQKNRRQAERRSQERREIPYPFGSPEWISAIQEGYLLWPKYDRRSKDRRNELRRQGSRRVKNSGIPESADYTKKMYGLLTAEEKQMLNELAQSDDTD